MKKKGKNKIPAVDNSPPIRHHIEPQLKKKVSDELIKGFEWYFPNEHSTYRELIDRWFLPVSFISLLKRRDSHLKKLENPKVRFKNIVQNKVKQCDIILIMIIERWIEHNFELIDEMKVFKPTLQSESDNVIHAKKKTSEENLTKWGDHTVAFLKAEQSVPFVRLISPNIKDDSLKHPYDWGLYRSQSEPNKVYEMLLLFATKGRTLNPWDFQNIKPNAFSQRIKRCNDWLMKMFNLNEKPIRPYSKKRIGYTARINITIQERKKGKDGLDYTDSNYDNPDLPTMGTDNYGDNIDDFELDDY